MRCNQLWFVQLYRWLSWFHQWNWFSEKQTPSGQQLVGCQSGKQTEQSRRTQLIFSLVRICLQGAGNLPQWCWPSHLNGLRRVVCGLENTVHVRATLAKLELISFSTHTEKERERETHTLAPANKYKRLQQTSLWHLPDRLSDLKGAAGRNRISYSQKLIFQG